MAAGRTIGIGVIGMGWMGTTHSRSYRRVPIQFEGCGIQPRLVICADEVETRARQAQDMLGFERCTTDWRRVIDDPDVEVVNIAAPNDKHLEMVNAAAAAGKHIFCEKPVGRNPQETAQIEYAARRAGVFNFVGFNYRWAPLVQHIRGLVEAGQFGALTHYRGRFFSMYGSSPYSVLSWRFQREFAGFGVLGDLMSHVYDMAHMLIGPARRVVATRRTFIEKRPLQTPGEGTHFTLRTDGPVAEVTNEDYVGCLVEFANGVQGTLETCRVIFGPKCEMAFEFNGAKGAASWNFERMNEAALYLPGEHGDHDAYMRVLSGPNLPAHGSFNPAPGAGLGYDDLKVIEAYQFLKSITDGKQGKPGFAEALAVAEFQAAAVRSWESGTWADIQSLRQED